MCVIESHYSRGGQAPIVGVKIQGIKFVFFFLGYKTSSSFLGCGFLTNGGIKVRLNLIEEIYNTIVLYANN